MTSLVVLPFLAATVLGVLYSMTPDRRWPPAEGERFALCILYVDADDNIAALHPSWDHTAASALTEISKLADNGARFFLPVLGDDAVLAWPEGGTYRYRVITPPARNPQVVRTMCDMPGAIQIETTYEASNDRVTPLMYSARLGYVAILWRVLAGIVLIVLPLLYFFGIAERRHEERRQGWRRGN